MWDVVMGEEFKITAYERMNVYISSNNRQALDRIAEINVALKVIILTQGY